MKDPEFIKLKNRFLLGILVALVFSVPLLIFVSKTYSSSNILTKIEKKETFTVIVTKKKCEMCKDALKVLKDNNVNYVELKMDSNKDYKEILRRLKVDNPKEEAPILIYVKDGEMFANLFSITKKSIAKEFISNHSLINSK